MAGSRPASAPAGVGVGVGVGGVKEGNGWDKERLAFPGGK